MKKYNIFLSHIHEEAHTANYIKNYLERRFHNNVQVFVSGDSIMGGEGWFEAIREFLRISDIVLILCSPFSIGRPWINFESGFAWGTNKVIIPLCHRQLRPAQLSDPLGSIQALDLAFADDIQQLIDRIAQESRLTPSNEDAVEFAHNLPNQSISQADFYISKVLLVPMTYDVTSILMTALQEGKKDYIVSTVHLFLGFLSLKDSSLCQVIHESGDDVESVREAMRKSIESQPLTENIPVTHTFRETMDEAMKLARSSGVLLDQIHILVSLFQTSRRLRKYLQDHGFKVNTWQETLEKKIGKKIYTPYQEVE